jgi:hypothetical protein
MRTSLFRPDEGTLDYHGGIVDVTVFPLHTPDVIALTFGINGISGPGPRGGGGREPVRVAGRDQGPGRGGEPVAFAEAMKKAKTPAVVA